MTENSKIEIEINNVNNIKNGKITVKENELNIKYGANGTGKSSFVKAIDLKSKRDTLEVLKSFNDYDNPSIDISSEFSNVVIFDENFVENIVFNNEQFIENGFEVFIKTPLYDERRNRLNTRLEKLKVDIGKSDEILELQSALDVITGKISKNDDGSLRRNPYIKGVLKRANIHNIPSELDKYKNFIEDEDNIQWIDWKSKGFKFDNKKLCPFCTDELKESYEEEKKVFKDTYDKNSAKNLKHLLDIFSELKEYMMEDKYIHLNSCIKTESDEETLKLNINKFVDEVIFLKNKINQIVNFDSYRIDNNEISKLDIKVKELLINSNNLDIFKSEKTLRIITNINNEINEIIMTIGDLKSEVGALNGYIQAAAKQSKNDINDFLMSAGMNYEVDIIVDDEGEAKTLLKYKCAEGITCDVKEINRHLSWGERNAFALVLFMYYSLQKKADLIVLDDPISSFDSNKKYAIINRLFKKRSNRDSFYGKTVLMMTHDFEPVIDFVINNKPTGGFVNADFIKNIDGHIKEDAINNECIKPITAILNENSKNSNIFKLNRIVFLRKLIELTVSTTDEQLSYDMMSSLIHGKEEPDKKIGKNEFELLSPEEKRKGINFIRTYIEDFDYNVYFNEVFKASTILSQYKDETNNYLKIQLFRVYIELKEIRKKIDDDVVLKFVDGVYHLENEYTYNLNILKFDVVPKYIIDRVNNFMVSELAN